LDNGNGYYNINLMKLGADSNQEQVMECGFRPKQPALPIAPIASIAGERKAVGIYWVNHVSFVPIPCILFFLPIRFSVI
jgi:hypothetical protein